MTTLSSGMPPTAEMTALDRLSLSVYQRPDHSGVKFLDVVDGELRDWAWQLYEHAFRELNENTVMRHMMYRHEFDEIMADPRWGKYVAFNTDGDIIGLSIYSNELDAVPLVSQAYFAKHYPEHHEQKRVWWVGFVAVSQEARGYITFNEIIKKMYSVSGDDAITGIDYAQVNIDRGLARAAFKYLERHVKGRGRIVVMSMVDLQGFFLYMYPRAEEVSA